MDLSSKERFLDICHFKRPNDLYLVTPYFHDFWSGTLDAWVKQGAPQEILDNRFRGKYFQLEHIRMLREVRLGTFMDRRIEIGDSAFVYEIPPIVPTYEVRFLREDERTVTLVNEGGQTVRVARDYPEKMPTYLDHPVKDRESWEEYRKRLDPDSPERWPAEWDAYVKRMNGRQEPIMLNVGGLFGFLREWTGTERLLYMFYDDPVLVEDMMEHVCYLQREVVRRVLRDIKVDCAMFWEDMAFKSGPLISPSMVRRFMLPRYRMVTDILHGAGVDVVFVDSDGNLNELVPLWLESGINGYWPLECAASNDAVALRKKYGKDVILAGNIDKRALLRGEEAIRQEVASKVPFLLESGGYFPSVDHLVPPDVTFERYRYFIDTLREVVGLEPLPN